MMVVLVSPCFSTAAAVQSSILAGICLVALVSPCYSVAASAREWSEFNPQEEDRYATPNLDFLFPDQLHRLKKQVSHQNPGVIRLPTEEGQASPGVSLVYPQPPEESPNLDLFSHSERTVVVPLSPFLPTGCVGADYCEGGEVQDYPDPALLRRLVRNKTTLIDAAVLFQPPEEGILLPQGVQTRAKAAVPIAGGATASDAQPRLRPARPTTFGISTDDRKEVLSPELKDGSLYEFVQEVAVCDSEESFVYPRTARNINSEWRFVINLEGTTPEDNFVQAVKVEKCLNAGNSCNIYSASGSKTVCRQKYSYKRLLAINAKGEQYVDSFRFPSCCVCYEQKTFGFNNELELLRTGEQRATLLPAEGDGVGVSEKLVHASSKGDSQPALEPSKDDSQRILERDIRTPRRAAA